MLCGLWYWARPWRRRIGRAAQSAEVALTSREGPDLLYSALSFASWRKRPITRARPEIIDSVRFSSPGWVWKFWKNFAASRLWEALPRAAWGRFDWGQRSWAVRWGRSAFGARNFLFRKGKPLLASFATHLIPQSSEFFSSGLCMETSFRSAAIPAWQIITKAGVSAENAGNAFRLVRL